MPFYLPVMTVRLLAACRLFLLVKSYEISFRTHGQFTNFSALRGEMLVRRKQRFLMSSFHLTFFFSFFSPPPLLPPPPLPLPPPVTSDQLISGPHATGSECRSHAGRGGHARRASGCYSDVRGAFKQLSLRRAPADD